MEIEIDEKEFTARATIESEDGEAGVKWDTFEVWVSVNGFDFDVTDKVVDHKACIESLEKRLLSEYWSNIDDERATLWND
jgi:hypothetical protein